MGGLFGGGAPAPAPAPPPPPAATDTDVKSAARDERLRRAKAQGRSSTILTSNQGDTSSVTLGGAKLLGQ